MAKSPEPRYRARVSTPDKVKELRDSLLMTQSIHSSCVVVIFSPPEDSVESLAPGTTFDVETYFDAVQRGESDIDGPFFVVGDHTQQAVKSLRNQFPKNPLWSSIEAQVLICQRSSRSYSMLKSWGVLDNLKGETRATVTFQQKMFSLREDWMNYHEETKGMTTSEKKSILMGVKSARMLEYKLNTNSFNQIFGLATKSEAVWSRLAKIFTGDVACTGRTKAKIPRSASNFTSMGGIPEEHVLVLLDEVIHGAPLKDFSKNCKFYKAKARVQLEILESPSIKGTDWLESQKEWRHACSDSFVEMWGSTIINQGIKQKHPLPAGFWAMLQKNIDLDLAVNRTSAAIRAVSAMFYV